MLGRALPARIGVPLTLTAAAVNESPWRAAALGAMSPRPRLRLSEWADRFRVVAAGTSPEPDRWRTSRVPFMREILDAVSNPAIERVSVMAASQVGKSELILNVIGYFIDADPSAMLLVQPTQDASQAFMKERIEPMVRATPALAGKLAGGPREKGNTLLLKTFPGGYLACAWATSAVSLASRPIRIVLLDELDRYPESTGRDGDPVAQAVQRTSNFHNRKIIAVSTPTVDGISPIAILYDQGDQRRLWVPCPRCSEMQVLRWSGVIYKNHLEEEDLDAVHYRCQFCKGRIEEQDRPAMMARCEWRPDVPGRRHRSYHLSALASPWVRWRDLAEQWIAIKGNRDQAGRREFINLRLGELWSDGDYQVSAEGLERRREEYSAPLPDGVRLLTAGVDVQDDRLEVEIVGWGAGRESWGVQYAILLGNTSSPAPWAALEALLARAWAFENGAALGIWRACVDSGGHRTDEVYDWCRPREPRIVPVKGRGGPGIPITTGKPTLVGQGRTWLYHVGSDAAKDAVYTRLQLDTTGPGFCHFPREPIAGYDGDYFRGLASERRKVEMRAGRRVSKWVQTAKRNEPLDCRQYALVALELAVLVDGVDLDKLAAPTPPDPGAPQPAAPPRRRIYSRGIDA